MKLKASLIGDTHAGVQQIWNQFANLTFELQDLKNGKETRSEVWCTKCKAEGHYKDQCLVFKDYLASATPNLVNPDLWCDIYRTRGQH